MRLIIVALILLSLTPGAAQAETLLWERILTGESLQQKLNQVYTPSIEEAARQEDIRTIAFRKEYSVNNQLPLMKFVEAMGKKENDPQRTLLLETVVTLYPKFPLNKEIRYLLGQSYLARYRENPQNKLLKEKSEKAFNAFLTDSQHQTAALNAYPFGKTHIKSGLYLSPYALMSLSDLYLVPRPVTRENLLSALDAVNQVASGYEEAFDENGESLRLHALLKMIALVREYPRLLDAKALEQQERTLAGILEFSDRSLVVPGDSRTYIYPYYYEAMGDIFFARQEFNRAISFYKELVLKYGDTVKWAGKKKLLEELRQRAIQEPEFEPYGIRLFQGLAEGEGPKRGYVYAYWVPVISDERGEKEKALAEYRNFLIQYSQAPDYAEQGGKFVPTEMGLAKNRIEALLGDPEEVRKFYAEVETEAPLQAYDLNFRVAWLFDQAGQKEKALILYKQYVKKFSVYPDTEETLFLTRKTQKGTAKDRIEALTQELNLEE